VRPDPGRAHPLAQVFGRPRGDSRSLFGELLDWVLAPLLFIWPMSLALTWIVAQNIAGRPYDAELRRLALALAAPAAAHEGPAGSSALAYRAEVERTAGTLFRGDAEPDRWFQVLGRRGELLLGEAALAVPLETPALDGTVRLRDDRLRDEPVRVAYLWLASGAGEPEGEALVQVAEALDLRQQLATEIIKSVLLPQFLVLPLAVVLLWLALSRGIRPLNELQQRIRRRQSHDLSPIPERDVPDEVAPLVAAINDLLQRLDQSMAIQRQFLADAAHQLKTPLAGLRTQAEVAAREIDEGRLDAAGLKHALVQIARSSQRAARMVNQLLAMARTEAGGQVLRRQWVDLWHITRGVVRDLVPRAMERRIDLGYEGPETQAEASHVPRLLAEPVLLGELVRNLVDNALQYTPAGGTVTVRVRLDRDDGSETLLLQVEDSGPGVNPSERELIFQPFYRSLDTQVDGSGLGLAIVKEVADRHGATVGVADAKPVRTGGPPGALFTVRFATGSPGPGRAPGAAAAPAAAPGAQP
jgi:two-component system sensor histidine kinase TctE